MEKVRLDKWLWAARFYRTRAKAKESIDGGKVHVNGERSKPGRDVRTGDEISARMGFDERVVIVSSLSDQRRGAKEAKLLYEETTESIERREREAEQRRLAGHLTADGRPSKRDRRKIHEFVDRNR